MKAVPKLPNVGLPADFWPPRSCSAPRRLQARFCLICTFSSSSSSSTIHSENNLDPSSLFSFCTNSKSVRVQTCGSSPRHNFYFVATMKLYCTPFVVGGGFTVVTKFKLRLVDYPQVCPSVRVRVVRAQENCGGERRKEGGRAGNECWMHRERGREGGREGGRERERE